MNDTQTETPSRGNIVSGLAVIGFIALVIGGMWLAVYSTRYVPGVVNRAGAAAVYLGSLFTPSSPHLSVVPAPTASTTISFGDATTSRASQVTSTPTNSKPSKTTKTTAGTKTNVTYQIGGTNSGAGLYGFPDLVVTIDAVGYLATSSTDSFVATSTVPVNGIPAVRFTIKNIGTNVAGPWRFSASIPTVNGYIYQSQLQQSLNPGDSIDYTLGFNQANVGTRETISVTANSDKTIQESNTDNNSASTVLTILGI